ncbi:hypothetical protein HDEF_1059 [Candidatus Hamiltonella defensa 5AT (Acyrthosiphon pisum)]|uniref:Uncharacterized protein n=1 Tax=Hamiltonella defensa subsp. Acyrthosiphon pisum (strain 5AT) TaxID=572265 RepID=C4K5A1_HAMD5|nr:hypothetical protein HDEF_1059 [Candidatus Hamiltonella defensa 5AT (Acyrthosiphon pisum)]
MSPTIRLLNRCHVRKTQFASLTALAGNGVKWRYRRFFLTTEWIHH